MNTPVRSYLVVESPNGDTGPDSAGQSGDTQGLHSQPEAGSESVLELLQEGQPFEAEVLMGIEEAPDPDVAEVYTQQDRAKPLRPERG